MLVLVSFNFEFLFKIWTFFHLTFMFVSQSSGTLKNHCIKNVIKSLNRLQWTAIWWGKQFPERRKNKTLLRWGVCVSLIRIKMNNNELIKSQWWWRSMNTEWSNVWLNDILNAWLSWLSRHKWSSLKRFDKRK